MLGLGLWDGGPQVDLQKEWFFISVRYLDAATSFRVRETLLGKFLAMSQSMQLHVSHPPTNPNVFGLPDFPT